MRNKEEKRRDWLAVRKFNRSLCFALSRTRYTELSYSEEERDQDDGIRLYMNVKYLSETKVEFTSGMIPTITFARVKSTTASKMTCCMNCKKDVKEAFYGINIRRHLYPKEEEDLFKRETWYKEFLKEIKEHPFFGKNAFNPFIVFPRENALLYS